jgi:hypothetical protein
MNKSNMEQSEDKIENITENPFTTRRDTLKASLLFFGSFFFSISFFLLLHEAGHALALIIKGYPGVRIEVNPFYGMTYYGAPIQPQDEIFISLAAPVFSIASISIITLILWFFRNQYLLPFLLTAGYVYLIEGLNGFGVFFRSLFDIRNDWGSLLDKGVHPVVLGLIFTLLIGISFIINWLVWPLLNISSNDSFWRVILIHSTYILYILLVLVVSTIFYSKTIPEYLIIVSIGVVLQIIFLVIRILFYNKVFTILNKVSHTKLVEHNWKAVSSSLLIACILIIIEVSIFRMS